MKPEHKKYIIENIHKKSLKTISRDLGIKERKIKKFLEKEGRERENLKFNKEREKQPKRGRGAALIFIILIIALGFTVYFNSLGGEYIYDDGDLIKNNLYIKSWSNISKIFTRDIFAGSARESNFYRPIQMITYMIDYSVWRLDVRGYHLTAVLLHILVAVSLYLLINALFDNRILAFFTSILFVAHPIHTEAVSYLSGRADPLCTLFILLSFFFYIRNISSGRPMWYILAFLSYIVACLSKEYSLILPALLLLYHFTFKKEIRISKFAPILVVTLIYIFLRATILKFPLSEGLYPSSLFQRLPGVFVAILDYLRLLFLPFSLHMEYGFRLFSFANPKVILGIVALSSLLIYATKERNNELVFFAISWFLITLLPVSNLYPINAYMAEHWLYLPSVGFFLILAKGLERLHNSERFRFLAIVFVVILLAFHSFLTIRQNNYWKNAVIFYERTLRYAPQKDRIYNNLGISYLATGNYNEAIKAFQKTVEANPKHKGVYNNLGIAYSRINEQGKAIEAYKKAIAVNPNVAQPYNNLGNSYAAIGNKEEAIRAYKKAIELNPNFAEAYNNLGTECLDVEEAIKAYQKAIELNPDYANAYYNLSKVYSAIGRTEEAIELHKKAKQLNPRLP